MTPPKNPADTMLSELLKISQSRVNQHAVDMDVIIVNVTSTMLEDWIGLVMGNAQKKCVFLLARGVLMVPYFHYLLQIKGRQKDTKNIINHDCHPKFWWSE